MTLKEFLTYGDKYNRYMLYYKKDGQYFGFEHSENGNNQDKILGTKIDKWSVVSFKQFYDKSQELPVMLVEIVKTSKWKEQDYRGYNHFPDEIVEELEKSCQEYFECESERVKGYRAKIKDLERKIAKYSQNEIDEDMEEQEKEYYVIDLLKLPAKF